MRHPTTFRVAFGASFLVCTICCSGVLRGQEKPLANGPLEGEYHIGTGDVLQIIVCDKETECAIFGAVVGADGSITIAPPRTVTLAPLKPTKIVGLSVQAVADLLREKLEPQFVNRPVTVSVRKIQHPPPTRFPPPLRDIPTPDHVFCCVA